MSNPAFERDAPKAERPLNFTLGVTEWSCVRMNRDAYWNPLVPELTVSDVETSLSFYAAVGFTVRFRRTDPEFVYIELGDAQLILSE